VGETSFDTLASSGDGQYGQESQTTRQEKRQQGSGAPKRRTNREHILPYREFPLFPHGSGRWAKKIRGKLHYFGRWDSADGATNWAMALADFKAKVDDLQAGRTPRISADGLTIRDLVNRFLTTKRRLVDTSGMAICGRSS
jgi:hypothetical protein